MNNDTPRTYGARGWTLEQLKHLNKPTIADLIAHIEELEAERDDAVAALGPDRKTHYEKSLEQQLQAAERVVEALRTFADRNLVPPSVIAALLAYDKEQADGR